MPSSSPRHRPSKGKPGTLGAYRKGCRCKACTAANTRKSREYRLSRQGAESTPIIHIFGGVHSGVRDDHHAGGASERNAGGDETGEWGDMETAVRADLAALADLTHPAINVLKASARALARELDNLDSRSSKAPLVKQLVEVMSQLTKKEAGSDDPLGFLSGLADEFPGAPVWNAPGSE